jgi:hypothetical protein
MQAAEDFEDWLRHRQTQVGVPYYNPVGFFPPNGAGYGVDSPLSMRLFFPAKMT